MKIETPRVAERGDKTRGSLSRDKARRSLSPEELQWLRVLTYAAKLPGDTTGDGCADPAALFGSYERNVPGATPERFTRFLAKLGTCETTRRSDSECAQSPAFPVAVPTERIVVFPALAALAVRYGLDMGAQQWQRPHGVRRLRGNARPLSWPAELDALCEEVAELWQRRDRLVYRRTSSLVEARKRAISLFAQHNDFGISLKGWKSSDLPAAAIDHAEFLCSGRQRAGVISHLYSGIEAIHGAPADCTIDLIPSWYSSETTGVLFRPVYRRKSKRALETAA